MLVRISSRIRKTCREGEYDVNDIVEKVNDMCRRCRESNADDEQYMVIRLDDLETLVNLAQKGSVFTDMVNAWIRLTKDEKEERHE